MRTPIAIINVDRNVSKRDYDDDHANEVLRVTSHFYTFQGEGPFAGFPALFIRLAGCNIGAKQDCAWCDTKFDFDKGRHMDLDTLQSVIRMYPLARVVVVTGGEPLLQWRTLRGMIGEVNLSRGRAKWPASANELSWQIETNGMLIRSDMVTEFRALGVHVVVSPKIPHGHGGYKPFPTANLWRPTRAGDSALYVKYVVSADPLSPYHLPSDEAQVMAQLGIPVYISGMTVYRRAPDTMRGEIANLWDDELVDRAATALNYAHAAQIALAGGYRVSYQMHLLGAVE